MNAIIDTVSKMYSNGASLKKIARELDLSAQKVRKILITLGLYSSGMVKAVQERRENGMSISAIAQELNIKTNTVHSYLPYTKTMYNTSQPSQNALNIRKHRANKA